MVASPHVPHGVMFHHFWNERHPKGQGAITAEETERLLHHVGIDRIIPAQEWLLRALSNTLEPHHVCLTFDDALKCQTEVALPVLERHGLTAFWFVYTSVIDGNLEWLELYRYFRTTRFKDIDEFYDAFHDTAEDLLPGTRKRAADTMPQNYLADFPFYTPQDILFRFTRDHVLKPANYERVMQTMLENFAFDPQKAAKELWLDPNDLSRLKQTGHVIGLHTHTHPTTTGLLPVERQRSEYETNYHRLTDILGEPPTTMSHPCNSYSPETLQILQSLGIKLGFRANMAQTTFSDLEHPRQDHANIMTEMTNLAR